MSRRLKRTYRPGIEGMEERCVATANLVGGGLGVNAFAQVAAENGAIVAAHAPRFARGKRL